MLLPHSLDTCGRQNYLYNCRQAPQAAGVPDPPCLPSRERQGSSQRPKSSAYAKPEGYVVDWGRLIPQGGLRGQNRQGGHRPMETETCPALPPQKAPAWA